MTTTDLIHHPDECRLGKKDAQPPHAMLHDFLDFEKAKATIAVPNNVINSSTTAGGTPMAIALAMYLNDKEGDCTIAGAANTLRVNSNGATAIADSDVQTGYVAVTAKENNGQGYDPSTGANDNGCYETDVLDYWVQVGLGSDKLLGHAGVDMKNDEQVKLVCYLTGSVYTGDQLAVAQQSQQVWDYTAGSPPWGGHCPPTIDIYDSTPSGLVVAGAAIPAGSQLDVIATWGGYKATTRPFRHNQCDEGHALITDAWLPKAKALGIIDETALAAYLKTLQSEA